MGVMCFCSECSFPEIFLLIYSCFCCCSCFLRLDILACLFPKQFTVGVPSFKKRAGRAGWPRPELCVQALCRVLSSSSPPLVLPLSSGRAGQPCVVLLSCCPLAAILLLSFIFLPFVVLMSSCCRALYAAVRGREQQFLPTNRD